MSVWTTCTPPFPKPRRQKVLFIVECCGCAFTPTHFCSPFLPVSPHVHCVHLACKLPQLSPLPFPLSSAAAPHPAQAGGWSTTSWARAPGAASGWMSRGKRNSICPVAYIHIESVFSLLVVERACPQGEEGFGAPWVTPEVAIRHLELCSTPSGRKGVRHGESAALPSSPFARAFSAWPAARIQAAGGPRVP